MLDEPGCGGRAVEQSGELAIEVALSAPLDVSPVVRGVVDVRRVHAGHDHASQVGP